MGSSQPTRYDFRAPATEYGFYDSYRETFTSRAVSSTIFLAIRPVCSRAHACDSPTIIAVPSESADYKHERANLPFDSFQVDAIFAAVRESLRFTRDRRRSGQKTLSRSPKIRFREIPNSCLPSRSGETSHFPFRRSPSLLINRRLTLTHHLCSVRREIIRHE